MRNRTSPVGALHFAVAAATVLAAASLGWAEADGTGGGESPDGEPSGSRRESGEEVKDRAGRHRTACLFDNDGNADLVATSSTATVSGKDSMGQCTRQAAGRLGGNSPCT